MIKLWQNRDRSVLSLISQATSRQSASHISRLCDASTFILCLEDSNSMQFGDGTFIDWWMDKLTIKTIYQLHPIRNLHRFTLRHTFLTIHQETPWFCHAWMGLGMPRRSSSRLMESPMPPWMQRISPGLWQKQPVCSFRCKRSIKHGKTTSLTIINQL